jgi:hypothetical protein
MLHRVHRRAALGSAQCLRAGPSLARDGLRCPGLPARPLTAGAPVRRRAQRIEVHREGVDWQAPEGKQLDLDQRVYVRLDPAHFLAFAPEELASV